MTSPENIIAQCLQTSRSREEEAAEIQAKGTPPFVGSLPPPELVASRPGFGNLAHLRFFDLDHFRAGNFYNKLSFWHALLDKWPWGYSCLGPGRQCNAPSFGVAFDCRAV